MSTNRFFRTGRVAYMLLFSALATPAFAQTAADQPATTSRGDDDGFDNWGLLGLLGLAGLLGRRRHRDVVETRRA